MKRVYIASPYTYKGPTLNIFQRIYGRYIEWKRFIEAAKLQGSLIEKYNIACYGPILESHLLVLIGKLTGGGCHKHSGSWSDWREYDLTMLDGCHELWRLKMPGFDKSTGLNAEVEYCHQKGIPVYDVNIRTLALTKVPKPRIKKNVKRTTIHS